jgi:hypothetical protein
MLSSSEDSESDSEDSESKEVFVLILQSPSKYKGFESSLICWISCYLISSTSFIWAISMFLFYYSYFFSVFNVVLLN